MGLLGEDGKPVTAEQAPEAFAEEAARHEQAQVEALRKAQIEALVKLLTPWDGERESLANFLLTEEVAREARAILFPTSTRVEVEVKPNGRISVLGPQNPHAVLRLLRDATDEVLLSILKFRMMEAFARPQIAKPSMRGVLSLAKKV